MTGTGMQCEGCGVNNPVGAVICEACGEVLEVSVAAGIASQKSTTASAGTGPSASSAVAIVQSCRLVVNGKVDPTKEFEVPDDDCTLLLGRTDLDEGIIPDVDLTKFGEKVTQSGKVGYTFSRKQAYLRRALGRVYLKAEGSARTMYKPQSGDWVTIAQGNEQELYVGDRFRFGGSEGYVMFEVA